MVVHGVANPARVVLTPVVPIARLRPAHTCVTTAAARSNASTAGGLWPALPAFSCRKGRYSRIVVGSSRSRDGNRTSIVFLSTSTSSSSDLLPPSPPSSQHGAAQAPDSLEPLRRRGTEQQRNTKKRERPQGASLALRSLASLGRLNGSLRTLYCTSTSPTAHTIIVQVQVLDLVQCLYPAHGVCRESPTLRATSLAS